MMEPVTAVGPPEAFCSKVRTPEALPDRTHTDLTDIFLCCRDDKG